MKYSAQGKHLLVDFFGVAADKLRHRKQLMAVLCDALQKEGFNILTKTASHQFKGGGQGVTGFVLLCESHAAFHSYPEKGYIALDIYTCGHHQPVKIAKILEEYLRPSYVKRVMQKRGFTDGSKR